MFMHHLHVWCPWRPEEDVRSFGIRVTGDCQSPGGCSESNPDALEEQPVLLKLSHLSKSLMFFLIKLSQVSYVLFVLNTKKAKKTKQKTQNPPSRKTTTTKPTSVSYMLNGSFFHV